MRARRLVPLLLSCSCQSRICRDPDVWSAPEYVAHRASAPVIIDGDVTDAAWAAATWTDPWRRSNVRGPGRQETRAKVLWDDTTVYVAFDVRDDDVVSPYTKDDEPLYESEAAEIFIDADRDGRTYDEIELSPGDKLFDANFVARRQGMNLGWSSGTRHAVKVEGTLNDSNDTDRGWTGELAIPIAALSAVPRTPPVEGDRWRFNLYRLDHGRGSDEGQAFSPVLVGDFHHLPKFGTLVFAK